MAPPFTQDSLTLYVKLSHILTTCSSEPLKLIESKAKNKEQEITNPKL